VTSRKALGYAARLAWQRQEASRQRIQAALTPMVEALTDPDEARRQAAAGHVLRACIPAALGHLADHLVDLLGGSGPARPQALASLVEFGHRAVPSLIRRFMCTRSVPLQGGIVEALSRIVGGLGPDQRFDLLTEMMILPRFATDDVVRQGLAGLVVRLRRANEPCPRATRP